MILFRAFLMVVFVGAGLFKQSGHSGAVAEFEQVGFGHAARYVTATPEITGAILLMLPHTIPSGALLVGAICVGAFFARLLMLHSVVIHSLEPTAILGAIARSKSGQLAGAR